MPIVVIDNREIEIPAGRPLNGIEAARLAGIEIPHYCWHPGLSVVGSCRMCLVEVGSRDPKTGKITMQSEARAGLQYGGGRRHGAGDQQREGGPRPGDGRRRPAAAAPDRLPDLRQGGRVQVAGLSLPVRPRRAPGRHSSLHQPPPRPGRRDAVRRSLRDVQPLRALYRRNQRHQRVDVHRPQRRTKKSTSCPAFPCTTSFPATWSIFARSGPWATRSFCIGSGCGSCGSIAGICTGCATGCSIWIDENQDRIYRIKPRENPLVNQVVDLQRRPLRLSARSQSATA